jgi:hypothetical protein
VTGAWLAAWVALAAPAAEGARVAGGDAGAVDTGPPRRAAAAEELWRQRSRGHDGGRAAVEPIAAAVRAYEGLVAAEPQDIAARWGLLRAFYFLGDYALSDAEEKLVLFERGRDLAEDSLSLLHRRIGLTAQERRPEAVAAAVAAAAERGLVTTQDAAHLYYYAAIQWGLWGRSTGKMKAARQGVAGRLRDYAEIVVLLDERLADAGGLRFLGRLHTDAPRIPLFTGWIDRERGIEALERASRLAPGEPANPVYLADALLRFARERESEAIALLERAVATLPRPTHVVEDTATLSEARQILAAHARP